jgi:hypothetical protein
LSARSIEIQAAMTGALRLAQMDRGGLAFFDRSSTGFWRSFYAASLVLPIYILTLLLIGRMPPDAGGWALEGIAYAISWLAFPCLMLTLVELMDREARYFDYMVPYIWASVPQNGLLMLVAVINATGVIPPEIGKLLGLSAFFSILAYKWYIAQIGLDISGRAALGLVVVDVSLDVMIQLMMELSLPG